MSQIKALYRLQKIDLELDAQRRRMREINAVLEGNGGLGDVRAEVAALQDALHKQEARSADLNLEIKSIAEGIVYGAFEKIQGKAKQDPVQVFHDALNNVAPAIEVRSRRVGGATYQVPVEVRPTRREALAIRWLITAAKNRNENTMEERLAAELPDAVNGRGTAVKKREDTHKMADANKAFSHYRF